MNELLLQIDWGSLQARIGGEKVTDIILFAVIIIATLLLKKPIAKLIAKLSSGIATRFTDKKHGQLFCELVQHPMEQLLQTILFFVAINQLGVMLNQFVVHRYKGKNEQIAIRLGDVADHIFLFFTILFAILVLSRVIDFIYRVQQDKATAEGNRERQQLLPLVKDVAKLVLWTIGLFWTLGAVFHVNIPALIAGLGIGGVAIALAAKESVENLFAAFTILSDKPFQVGDNIKLGSLEGNVERIGFRSTRLRSADGSAYIIPNQKLVNENLENQTKRDKRRIKQVVNIRYGLKHADLEAIVAQLKQLIKNTAHAIEPIDINLESFGENVFQLVISYYLPHPLKDDTELNTIKHEVNMGIYKIVGAYAGTNNVTVQNNLQSEIQPEEDKKDDSLI